MEDGGAGVGRRVEVSVSLLHVIYTSKCKLFLALSIQQRMESSRDLHHCSVICVVKH